MTHIAIVTTSYPDVAGDPAGHFVEAEALSLTSKHRVSVIAPGQTETVSNGNPCVHRISSGTAFGSPGVLSRLKQRPHRVSGVVKFIRLARRRLEEIRPDRVQAHWLIPGLWPISGSADRHVEAVAHGSDVELFLRFPRFARLALVRSAVRRGVQLRFVSMDLQDRFVAATTPEVRACSRVEPCPIRLPPVPSRVVAREQLGVGARERLLVIVARLVAQKRVEVALRALSLLRECTVVVLGIGPESPRLMRQFPNVRFLGQRLRPETLTWIRAANVVVSASQREGAPTAIREATQLGTPVVTSICSDLAIGDGLYVASHE